MFCICGLFCQLNISSELPYVDLGFSAEQETEGLCKLDISAEINFLYILSQAATDLTNEILQEQRYKYIDGAYHLYAARPNRRGEDAYEGKEDVLTLFVGSIFLRIM